ncbi:MAG TPA: signal peptidase II [Clostridiales bacterium]|nr:signal peptidase II [Clostridiales bacterium]
MTYALAIISALILLFADQLSKYYISSNFYYGQSEPIIDGVVNFTYIHNRGAAFGILQDQQWLFLSLTAIILVLCLGMLIKKTFNSRMMFWALTLIITGGLGNLIDRIFRGGNVVDFIDLQFVKFAIFNIADCCVVVGASLVVLYFIIDTFKDYTKGKPVNTGEEG